MIPQLEPKKVYEAIADGVQRAMWGMITNSTQMPCHDFYDTIEKAAKSAFSGLADDIVQRVGDEIHHALEYRAGEANEYNPDNIGTVIANAFEAAAKRKEP